MIGRKNLARILLEASEGRDALATVGKMASTRRSVHDPREMSALRVPRNVLPVGLTPYLSGYKGLDIP